MLAMTTKEFRQLKRDRRTLALLIVMPVLLLVVFGYAASFETDSLDTAVLGPDAERTADALPELFDVNTVRSEGGREAAEDLLRNGDAAVVLLTADEPMALIDGSRYFMARTALEATSRAGVEAEVLFNPDLETSSMMVPALVGLILVFVGTLATALGVVRERQAGTLEQLAVMPLTARDVFVGKIAPYFVLAAADMVVVVIAGLLLFDVPFEGSPLVFATAAAVFLLVTLGIGVLISTVSETQGEAIQLAMMTLLPQVLLSGMIFPLESMAPGVRWIGYLLPLTYFNEISRGIMLRGAPLDSLLVPFGLLVLLGVVVFGAAVLRFRRDLAPARQPA